MSRLFSRMYCLQHDAPARVEDMIRTVNWGRFAGLNTFRPYKRLSLIALNNKYLWPRQRRKSISMKASTAQAKTANI